MDRPQAAREVHTDRRLDQTRIWADLAELDRRIHSSTAHLDAAAPEEALKRRRAVGSIYETSEAQEIDGVDVDYEFDVSLLQELVS